MQQSQDVRVPVESYQRLEVSSFLSSLGTMRCLISGHGWWMQSVDPTNAGNVRALVIRIGFRDYIVL